ncbi:MAG TPA: O-methyltransferase [Bacteroidales bacterium]|nr:O-methyltransferase [Bacteroidales bacterium]
MDRETEDYILRHSSKEDPILEDLYRQTYLKFVNPNMTSGHIQGKLLELLAKMINPLNILEIGTYTGYSAISLARGLREEGRLVTIECNDELADFSREYFIRAGVGKKILQLIGKAQDLVPGLDMQFGLVFIDGDKREYCEYFRMVIDKVEPGGYILADNVLWGGKTLDINTRDQQTRGIISFNEMITREKGIENIILPVRDGLMIIRKCE